MYITDTPAFLAVMVRRRPFFQENPLAMFLTAWVVYHAVRQSQGGATPRDGSFDQSGGYQELRGEWSMRRADELSIVHQNQEG